MSEETRAAEAPAPGRTGTVSPLLGLALPVLLAGVLFSLRHEDQGLRSSLAVPGTTARAEPHLPPLPLGTVAPALCARDASGRIRTHLGVLGRPLMLVITPPVNQMCWIDWRSLVRCQSILQAYGDIGLTAAVVAESPPPAMREKVRDYGIRIPLLSDVDRRTWAAFHADDRIGFELFLIDQRGEIAFRHAAPIEDDDVPLPRCLNFIRGDMRPDRWK